MTYQSCHTLLDHVRWWSFRIVTSVFKSDTGHCCPQQKGRPKLPSALFLKLGIPRPVFLPNSFEQTNSAQCVCAGGGGGAGRRTEGLRPQILKPSWPGGQSHLCPSLAVPRHQASASRYQLIMPTPTCQVQHQEVAVRTSSVWRCSGKAGLTSTVPGKSGLNNTGLPYFHFFSEAQICQILLQDILGTQRWLDI